MCGFILGLSLFCSSVVANDPPPPAAQERSAVLTALVYDTVGVPSSVVRSAMGYVNSVYELAGIRLLWTACPCWRDSGRVDACNHSLGADELVVRIVRRAKASRWNPDASALGVALVADGAPGHYASVFYDRIKEVSTVRRAPAAFALGAAIAHEIGHLLLRSTAHSVAGLMRKDWDRDSQRRAEQGRLLLLPAEAERVRAEALSRKEEAVRSHPKLAAEYSTPRR